jgi:predicted metal-dependent HD superfamily phosphohydrolase
MVESLRMEAWKCDLIEAGIEPSAEHWEELVRLHADRAYHNLIHVAAVREAVVGLGGLPATRLAAWYHDAVYEPARTDNEDASARLARERLAATQETVEEVERLILLSKTHSPEVDDLQGQILCDADLAILAAPPEDYCRYAEAIRKEYDFVDDRTFWQGRAQVLQSLLSRPAIYHTPGMQEAEAAARVNVLTELSWLQIRIGNG